MDYDDEDPWARISPNVEKVEPTSSSNAGITTGSQDQLTNDDNAAWDAQSDDDNDDHGQNNNQFIEAASRLSLSTRDRNNDDNATATNDEDADGDGEDNDNAFEDAVQGMTVPSTPLAETSTSSAFLSPPSTTTAIPHSGFLAPPNAAFESTNTMDDFEDDDGFGEPSNAQTGGNDDDDFGDFGDEAQAGTGLDDDDFGDFDEAGPSTAPMPSGTQEAPPVASTSTLPGPLPGLPPYGRIVEPPDFEAAFRNAPEGESELETLTRITNQFFEAAYPGFEESMYTDDPIPDMSDLTVEDAFLGKKGESTLRDIYTRLTGEPIDSKPWDWKKSKVRLAAMREVGLPVNLDDFADPPAKPMAPLVLPSIKTTAPPSASGTNGRASTSNLKSPISRSASPSAKASSSTAAAGASISRSSTPAHSLPSLPKIDLERCRSLAEKTEEELSFLTVAQLNALREDLQSTAVDASNHLRGLLERKEMLQGQNEGYNAMIQDLVVAAQKMRSSTSAGSAASRKPSIKRPNDSAKPAPGVGISSNSHSRPASPANAGQGGLRSSLGRSAVTGSSAGKEQVRRSSLW